MTSCVGAGTYLALLGLRVVLPLAVVPALLALVALRRGGWTRLLPALGYAAAGLYAALEATPVGRPWIPTVLLVTAALWLPRSPKPFPPEGRAWLSFAASFAVLTAAMLEFEASSRSYCGLV